MCGHGKWKHRQGRKGCSDVECGGACDRYEPVDVPAQPVDQAAPAEPAATGEQVATCAYPGDVEHDHEMCVDAVAERDGEPEPAPEQTPEPVDEPAAAVDERDALIERLRGDLSMARAKGKLQHEALTGTAAQVKLLAEANSALAEQLATMQRDLARARSELTVAAAADERTEQQRQAAVAEALRLREQLDDMARQRNDARRLATLTAKPQQAGEVLGRYDAEQCPACGSRYTVPNLDHPCGPLRPVTVLVVDRQPQPQER